MLEQIAPRPPFNFLQMLNRPLSRPSSLVRIDADAGSYTRVIRTASGAVVPVTVTGASTVDAPRLTLETPDDISNPARAEVRACVERMFSTQVDILQFYEHMRVEPAWQPLIDRLYGVRPLLDVNLFESMIRTIVGQQLNVQFAAVLVERLVEFVGETVTWNGTVLAAFPSPEQVARLSYEQLRTLQFSQRKAEYVIDFAREIASGNIDLETCWNLQDDQIYDLLVPLRGIGRWTVECFLLFGMGRQDLMPAADIGVQNAMQRLYDLQIRPKEPEIRVLSEKWKPWRSYATYYLWQSLIP